MLALLLSVTQGLVVLEADRRINCRVAHVQELVQLSLQDESEISEFVYSVGRLPQGRVAVITFGMENKGLQYELLEPANNSYVVRLPKSQQKNNIRVDVMIHYTSRHQNLPRKIASNQNQMLKFNFNRVLDSPYKVLRQSVQVQFQSIERHSEGGTKKRSIVYFNDTDTAAHSFSAAFVHGVNNVPQIEFSQVHRSIEVSHWGNIYTHSSFKLSNVGPGLSGQFSRVDYTDNNAKNALRQISTRLPKDIWGLYYRDQVGNVTTSHARRTASHVLFEMQPRFMVLGGWNSNWTISYNQPSTGHILVNEQDPESFKLQNILQGYEFPDVPSDLYELRISLPQKAVVTNLGLIGTRFQREKDLSFSYLDFEGKPTVVLTARGYLPSQFQNAKITLEYSFNQKLNVRKLTYCILGALFLFLGSVVVGRFSLQTLDIEYEHDKKII